MIVATFGDTDFSNRTILAVGSYLHLPRRCILCKRIVWPWQRMTIRHDFAAVSNYELFPVGLHYESCLGPWIEAEKKKNEPPHKETYDYKVHAVTIRHWISPDVYFDEIRKDPDKQPS